MSSLYTISDSVIGGHHETCEDACDCRRSSDGTSLLFAVADGHGDPTCVRSAKGSQLAVGVALEQLDKLATSLTERRHAKPVDEPRVTRIEGMVIPANIIPGERARPLADLVDELEEARSGAELTETPDIVKDFAKDIVLKWNKAVIRDLTDNPLTNEEIAQVRRKGRRWDEEHPIRLYGSTLLAGALVPEGLVLFQQGDGCCAVVSADGAVTCPIPEDVRNVGNVTASLCDGDAAESLARRVALVRREQDDPIACVMATDGVEKSVMGEEGVKDYCAGVVIEAVRLGEAKARAALHDSLVWMSKEGAGDDTTVAGYVDVERVAQVVDILERKRLQFADEIEERLLRERKISLAGVKNKIEQLDERQRELDKEHDEQTRVLEEERQAFQERFGSQLEEYQQIEQRMAEIDERKRRAAEPVTMPSDALPDATKPPSAPAHMRKGAEQDAAPPPISTPDPHADAKTLVIPEELQVEPDAAPAMGLPSGGASDATGARQEPPAEFPSIGSESLPAAPSVRPQLKADQRGRFRWLLVLVAIIGCVAVAYSVVLLVGLGVDIEGGGRVAQTQPTSSEAKEPDKATDDGAKEKLDDRFPEGDPDGGKAIEAIREAVERLGDRSAGGGMASQGLAEMLDVSEEDASWLRNLDAEVDGLAAESIERFRVGNAEWEKSAPDYATLIVPCKDATSVVDEVAGATGETGKLVSFDSQGPEYADAKIVIDAAIEPDGHSVIDENGNQTELKLNDSPMEFELRKSATDPTAGGGGRVDDGAETKREEPKWEIVFGGMDGDSAAESAVSSLQLETHIASYENGVWKVDEKALGKAIGDATGFTYACTRARELKQ